MLVFITSQLKLEINTGKFYLRKHECKIFVVRKFHYLKWLTKLAKIYPWWKFPTIQRQNLSAGRMRISLQCDYAMVPFLICCHACIPELVGGISSEAGEACVQHETKQKYHLCLGTWGTGLAGWHADELCLKRTSVGETFVGGSGWWVVGCWSMNCSTICASSSRSCWGCQSTSDSISPMMTLMGFSKPPLGVTIPEEMRFLITLNSRFLRTVVPARGRPVNKHLTDLCLIFLWWRYFSSKFFSWISVSVFMQTKSIKSNYQCSSKNVYLQDQVPLPSLCFHESLVTAVKMTQLSFQTCSELRNCT